MKIERGEYRTAGGHHAWVSEVRHGRAVGFIQRCCDILPIAWDATTGQHWRDQPGRVPDYDIAGPWVEPDKPSDPQPLITGPGDYVDALGRKVKIAATGSGYAFGVTPEGPLGAWCAATGRKIVDGNPSLDGAITSPWKEPPQTATFDVALIKRSGGELSVFFDVHRARMWGKILGRKTVTITEGEGM